MTKKSRQSIAVQNAAIVGQVNRNKPTKPPYYVPTMEEINASPYNGFTVISTFSGGGGSSLGYRMAGFKVLWANEFIPAAQETYRANHPDTLLDTRDIRTITGREILDAIGLDVGALDVFDGSPPCASFSTAGKRNKSWGQVKAYSDTSQRTDDLFFEYARLLHELQPKVFVAENVSGLIKGTAKGYFIEILTALKQAGYKVEARVLDASWLGVPQSRQRLIFVGVRNDLHLQPVHPKPLSYQYTVRDAIPWITRVEEANGLNSKGLGRHRMLDLEGKPFPTIQAQRPVNVEPETSLEGYSVGELWDEIEIGEHHKTRFSLAKIPIDKPSFTVSSTMGNDKGQVKYAGALTHPYEKRYLSIAELKRICAFPDDYVLTGSYAQQWERLGRAVPPVMMQHIASTIRDSILCQLS